MASCFNYHYGLNGCNYQIMRFLRLAKKDKRTAMKSRGSVDWLLARVGGIVRGERQQRIRHWQMHPSGEYFLGRGGDEVQPPFCCNIGLTNKCNLRCEICGSQKETGVRRRHMELKTFEAVAETLFPLLVTVELNSQGDPLLYPYIETVLERIHAHGCEIKVQTNGTLFTDRILPLLLAQYGTVMLSLDAVGPKFDEVRSGGIWAKAEPGLQRLLASRDPSRLSVGIYPTLTERTIGEALNVVRWAAEQRADQVSFHRYVPILNSWEKAPSEQEYLATRDRLALWLADNGNPIEVRFENDVLNQRFVHSRRTKFLGSKQLAFWRKMPPTMPTEAAARNADKNRICAAPASYVEIGLEGQIAACCRSQDVPLGYATSVESFADAWFGANYARLRRSLRRDHGGGYALPNCEACVNFFAPVAGKGRRSIDYTSENRSEDALDFGRFDEILIDQIRTERGLCFTARIPPGLEERSVALYEDGRRLSAHCSQHNDIRELGGGRFAVHGQSLYFSTSDGTDARRNGRQYHLRLVSLHEGDLPLGPLVLDGKYAYVAELPHAVEAQEFDLLEDEKILGPSNCLHDAIRSEGGGRYSIQGATVYFSASDNSDPRVNRRYYHLRRLVRQAAE